MDLHSARTSTSIETEIAVVGAGPAGIVLALELAREGHQVVIVESGKLRYDASAQELADAEEWDATRHAPMSMATRRQVGGASVIWGGRCVPYDPIDFEPREIATDSRWPLGYTDVQPYFQRACDWLVCGRAVFDSTGIASIPPAIVPGFINAEVSTSALERWSLPTDFGREYRRELASLENLRVATGLTCTEIVCLPDSGEVHHLLCKSLSGSEVTLHAKKYVIAGGGLESTRLLMSSRGPGGEPLGDHSGHLGHWYMSHAEGVIADINFSTPPDQTSYDYERDIDGVYVRRRFTFSSALHQQEGLPNIAAWLANPELANAAHKSGQLSLAYLALRSPLGKIVSPEAQRLSLTGEDVPGAPYGPSEPSPISAHLSNMWRDPKSTLAFAFGFGARRFFPVKRKVPGFFSYNRNNTYPLQYHGEHLPLYASKVELTDRRDQLGMRKLRIDLQFSDTDVDTVVRAHRLWDEYLKKLAVGHLIYRQPDVAKHVAERLGGGFHQIGTTRMSEDPKDGVVDADLRVHGVSNLHVLGSSTFVTSGQANSTFMIVAFAVRLADFLRKTC